MPKLKQKTKKIQTNEEKSRGPKTNKPLHRSDSKKFPLRAPNPKQEFFKGNILVPLSLVEY